MSVTPEAHNSTAPSCQIRTCDTRGYTKLYIAVASRLAINGFFLTIMKYDTVFHCS
jgi:hypothetical protein